ncbi:L,D-transpeptidase family protein [Chitinimonas sp. PSY-7]|uniref:L,D-transpeptidase family protein n=1 Tax=Chitinimonas sp. PSY-7 TaxID=3459088 RepID=UPI0040400E76
MKPITRIYLILLCIILVTMAVVHFAHDSRKSIKSYFMSGTRYTVNERLTEYGSAVEARLRAEVVAAGLSYPPKELAYVAFKDARRLEVYGRTTSQQPWQFVKAYPILAASGNLGPKLKEGDEQVPEGIYQAESLNPNSRFHLSIRLNYPNAFDRHMAQGDKRHNLGGDIMIHGSSVSIGCIAVGDEAAEDLFILAAQTSKPVRIIVSPTDFRQPSVTTPETAQPTWLQTLYASLSAELQQYHVPPEKYQTSLYVNDTA